MVDPDGISSRVKSYAALLFDMDGTLLSSIAAAERIWRAWSEAHGIDFEELLPRLHGVRAVDTIRSLGLPGIHPEQEAERIGRAEIEDVTGVVPLDGVLAFLGSLPAGGWALVTSAPLELAQSRMRAAGIAMPAVVIAAEDVTHGKPAPDCFLRAAERLGVDVRDCLIFEDSPAGLTAARASGADVIMVTATHAPGHTSADLASIRSYDELSAGADGQRITLDRRPPAARRDGG